MSAYDELRLLATELYEHETRAGVVCPFCRGGRTGEGSLSITKLQAGAALYVCHRAACGRAGRVGENYGAHQASPVKLEFTPRLYDSSGDVDVYRGSEPTEWLGRFGIDSAEGAVPCRWNPANHRTVWEIRSSLGTLRGYELRAYRDEDRPKTLHYRHTPEPWVGWFGANSDGRHVVVAVEDLVSAYKVSMAGYRSASLMGTNLNLDKLLDLLRVSDRIVLALDRDATDTAKKYAQRYALLAPEMVVLSLQRDLKYEDTTTIRKMVEDVL